MTPLHPIPDSYWVAPGRLLAGEYPSALDDTLAQHKLTALFDAGVTLFVDLTEAGEHSLRAYWPMAQELAAARAHPIAHRRIPIQDFHVPEAAAMRHILDTVDAAVARGDTVYVHCFGGIGRTGTVVGCYLVRHGWDGAAALAEIARLRAETPDGCKLSPETDAQRSMVMRWQQDDAA